MLSGRVSRAAWWIMAVAIVAACGAAARGDEPVLTVQVVNDAGDAIEGAEAYLIENTNSMPFSRTWVKTNADGVARFDPASVGAGSRLEVVEQPVSLVVRAGGYAWSMQKITVPRLEPVRVVLNQGRSVEVVLGAAEGMELPRRLRPIVFAEGQSVAAWLTNVQEFNKEYGAEARFSAAIPEGLGGGRYRVAVPADCGRFWVLVNEAGFLRAFQAGPFEAEAMSEPIAIALPRPATLAIRLAPDEQTAHAYTNCATIVYASPEIPDGGWSFAVHVQYSPEQTLEAELTDLSPDFYSVNAMTGDKSTRGDRSRADYFQAQQGMNIAAGERSEANFAMQTYDEETLRAKLKGEHALKVKVSLADGSPAAGRSYALAFALQKFGRTMEVASGTVPESGEFTVNGLPAGSEAFLSLQIDDEDAGYVFIEGDQAETVYEVSVAPAVGDLAPDMELTRLSDGSTFRLSSLRGQVVYVDFWASWCGPCQEPMAHSDSVMSRRADWKDRAVIIGASIDNGIEIIREHVDRRGWTHVVQTFCSEGEAGWGCEAAKRYAVRGVPTCYLIDQSGRIAWTGHPSEIDVEKEIDALLGARR